jgi:hypothetical protein
MGPLAVPCFDKYQVLDAMREHIAKFGSRDWRRLRTRFPHVSEPTWWRWVREAKTSIGFQHCAQQNDLSADPPLPPESGGSGEVPAELSRPASAVPFDYMALHRQQLADAQMLRSHSLNSDGTIRNPTTFDRSIGLRIKLLARAFKFEQQIFDLRQSQKFFAAVVTEIGKASPELQKKVIDRLRLLDFGISARPPL